MQPEPLDYQRPHPTVPPEPPGRYGGAAIFLVSVCAFAGFGLILLGLFYLADQAGIGGSMFVTGVGLVVCTMRYLGRDNPRWRRAWICSTIAVAGACGTRAFSNRLINAPSAQGIREYEFGQQLDSRRIMARTDVTRLEFAGVVAWTSIVLTGTLWIWLISRSIQAVDREESKVVSINEE